MKPGAASPSTSPIQPPLGESPNMLEAGGVHVINAFGVAANGVSINKDSWSSTIFVPFWWCSPLTVFSSFVIRPTHNVEDRLAAEDAILTESPIDWLLSAGVSAPSDMTVVWKGSRKKQGWVGSSKTNWFSTAVHWMHTELCTILYSHRELSTILYSHTELSATLYLKVREAWGITERKKWPRDLPVFELRGPFAYRANALLTEPQVPVRGEWSLNPT